MHDSITQPSPTHPDSWLSHTVQPHLPRLMASHSPAFHTQTHSSITQSNPPHSDTQLHRTVQPHSSLPQHPSPTHLDSRLHHIVQHRPPHSWLPHTPKPCSQTGSRFHLTAHPAHQIHGSITVQPHTHRLTAPSHSPAPHDPDSAPSQHPTPHTLMRETHGSLTHPSHAHPDSWL